jgi:hypothetical protein
VRYADVDEHGWLHVRRNFTRGKVGRPKGGNTRRVRLTDSLAAELGDRRRATWADDETLVFAASQGARVNGHNFSRRIVKPAAKRANFGVWVSPHTLRHTSATLLFRAGWNAVQVQRFLGHADPGFTLRTYVHLLPEDLPSTEFPRRHHDRRGRRTIQSRATCPWEGRLVEARGESEHSTRSTRRTGARSSARRSGAAVRSALRATSRRADVTVFRRERRRGYHRLSTRNPER